MQSALISPPIFTKDFILYVSTTTNVVVWFLIHEYNDDSEHVVYYISKHLAGPSINHYHDKKLALVVVLPIQKLHHYILLCKIKVVANSKPNAIYTRPRTYHK